MHESIEVMIEMVFHEKAIWTESVANSPDWLVDLRTNPGTE